MKHSPSVFSLIVCWVGLVSFCLNAQTFTNSTTLLNPATNGFEWGANAVDVNSDGWVDIYEREKLYLNDEGQGFTNIYISTGLDDGSGTFGSVWGDYNNDGYLDVLFENFGPLSTLNKNNRNLTFDLANAETGLNPSILAQTCGWADFNNDGTLDIWLNDDNGNNKMYINNNHSTFQDISGSSNAPTNGNSYGMSWGDMNNDGLTDVFIATCPGGDVNHLLKNNGDETFTNIGNSAGVDNTAASWGNIWMDINNDGYQDIYVANTGGDPNLLYLNNRDETFTDISVSAGVTTTGGFGCAAGDFDNDGWIDIYVATSGPTHSLYRNNRNNTFTNISASAGITENEHDAVALADYNNDGWLDIFTAGSPQNRLMMNDGGSNNWIMIKTRGVTANHFGVGTRIEVYTNNGQKQLREIRAGESFCSQSDQLRAHFGLGSAATIDSILVHWTTGTKDKIESVSANQEITIVEGVGLSNPPISFTLTEPSDGGTATGGATINLNWESAASKSQGSITYRVYIWGNGVDLLFEDITSNTFDAPADMLTDGQTYNWMVDATDGFSIVASHDIFSFIYEEGELLSFNKSIDTGWNLLALPFQVSNPDYQVVFPNAQPNSLFYFDGGYVSATEMAECVGYWLNFEAAEIAQIQGFAINSCTTNLAQGWNLIGGPSCGVAVVDIDDPGSVITGDIFGFNGSYFAATTIEQGRGYWINATAPGTITLTCATTTPAKKETRLAAIDLSENSTVQIRDAAGYSQSLYFNAKFNDPAMISQFALPPISPAGSFDARFEGDIRLIESAEGVISVQSTNFPLTLTATNLSTESNKRYLIEERINGHVEAQHILQNGESIRILNPQINQLRLSAADEIVPDKFVLEQNYPNPFNPTTQVRFGIPEAATVSVAIYNSLGQKVKTLISERKEAGFYTVNWDATNDLNQPVSSGIYLYSLEAGKYRDIKKMIFLK